MALVKCPECGRENVSDTATSCPDCGYNIKAHYDKIKRDDEERIKAEEIRKQKEEKRKKDLAEKKRLEEVYKKEQEERERQEIEHKLEKQRNTKILYWCLGILVAVICVTMCIIGIQNENTEKALIELANNSFDADFESYKSALQGYGINIDATYEFGNMSYEEGVLSVDCNVTYTSSDIDKYRKVEYDSRDARKLCFILKDIDAVRRENSRYTYNSESGTVNITLFGDDSYYGIVVLDKDNCEYHYSYVVDWDELEINDETAFMEDDGSYQPSGDSNSSSYTGSYDATLEYGSGSVLVCISEDAMSRYMSALNNDNQGTIDEMQSSGEIGFTAKGTKCNIVERKVGKYQVKLLDGIYEGNTVWVISESVNEK